MFHNTLHGLAITYGDKPTTILVRMYLTNVRTL